MLDIEHVTKRFGKHTAVENLTFGVRPGVVTGFLGPNGAGKSTTMRIAVGLTRPDAGKILINGRPYEKLAAPLNEVGVLLDARAVHPRRSAYQHLAVLATTHGIPLRRVDEVLGLVGLSEVAGRRPGGFSLGMSQRLGIAGALLGDPGIVILDEPVNGLDPEGIRWVRRLLRGLAAEGRTVFLSSHLMSEMALTADRLVIIGRGRLVADVTTAELTAQHRPALRVRTPKAVDLLALVPGAADPADAQLVTITDRSAEAVAELAARHQIPLYELTPVRQSLEDAYLELTHDDVEYTLEGSTSR
ncbi:ABC transporter ATP-binding protein [Actinoplanes solisilvae]|uniref:ABC transporter ATP-binding protein n=1 Tax=Actinoplanes solisilvae TaxID=2486853 RepID=UPI000FD84095|nr:ABC transporter ATP-binding protein [Actinoplanes solisilvae]